jgi:hypothetical protein
MQCPWIAVASLTAAALAAPCANAQLSTLASPGAGPAIVGPTLNAATLSPHVVLAGQAAVPLPMAAAAERPFGLPQTLMIVGGAALLTGAIIGDDAGTIVMIAGAGVGLYGLYLFLREPSMGGTGDKPGIGLGYRLSTGL